MATPCKLKRISSILNKDIYGVISKMYLEEKMCPLEISNYLSTEVDINISPRSIQRNIVKMGIVRTKSESFNLSIGRGRKDYNHLKKTVKSRDLRKGINLKLRYQILKRDDFKCVLCGNSAKDDLLMIDHIIPVVKGGTNNLNNLRTLCRQCNLGKMIAEHEK
ncbi:MAG: HNH endonuclease [Patescibacteria group bacterium]